MAFVPVKNNTGAVEPREYLEAAAGEYSPGMALGISGGRVCKLTSASQLSPPYICMAQASAADGDILAVIRPDPGTVFESELDAASANAVPGAKFKVANGGLAVAAISGEETGCFELMSVEGTAKGSLVRGRFI